MRSGAGCGELALLLALGCGARSELEIDPSEEHLPPPGECDLVPLGDPLVVLAAPDSFYEGPRVVARLGGLDVGASRVGPGGDLAHVARRVRTDGSIRPEGDETVIGPDARSVGAIGSDGARLAIGWGDDFLEEPTRFAVYEGADYRLVSRATIGDGPGDFCVAMHAFDGHWLAAWSDRTLFETVVAELDDGGNLLSSPQPMPGFLASARHGRAVVLARAALAQVSVDFYDPGGVAEVTVPTPFPADSLWLTSSPFADDAVELGWYSPAGEAAVLRVHRDGGLEASVPFDVEPFMRTGPVVEAFAGEVVVARSEVLGHGMSEVSLYVRSRDGSLRDAHSFLSIGTPVPVLLADGARLYLVWLEETGAGSEVKLLPFGCD